MRHTWTFLSRNSSECCAGMKILHPISSLMGAVSDTAWVSKDVTEWKEKSIKFLGEVSMALLGENERGPLVNSIWIWMLPMIHIKGAGGGHLHLQLPPADVDACLHICVRQCVHDWSASAAISYRIIPRYFAQCINHRDPWALPQIQIFRPWGYKKDISPVDPFKVLETGRGAEGGGRKAFKVMKFCHNLKKKTCGDKRGPK